MSLQASILQRVKAERGLVELADVSPNDLLANKAVVSACDDAPTPPRSALWFIPVVDHVLKGGVRTIFSVAEQMSARWSTTNHFVIYSFSGADFDASPLERGFGDHFPRLKYLVHKFRRGQNSISGLPQTDAAFCTLWTTAYLLVKYNKTRRKYYFLQDFEPSFYPGGSVYGAIEATYRFGFSCIANTLGVAQKYRRYSADVMSFTPGIDHNVFYPADPREPSLQARVVFYGRPANDRNAFSLGLSVLDRTKRLLGDKVDLVSVGADWNPADLGMQGIVKNLGLLPTLKQVADLYRSADLGLVFMFSAHPSYQPLEYMACGCVPVTNINECNEWLLQDDENCLFLNPAPNEMAQNIAALLDDPPRMKRLRANGLESVKNLSWERAYTQILQFIEKPRHPPHRDTP